MKRYALHGIAGLVERRDNRITGRPMSLYAAEQAEMDTDDPWIVVCEDHNTMVSAPNLKLAQQSMAYPEWCEECSGASNDG